MSFAASSVASMSSQAALRKVFSLVLCGLGCQASKYSKLQSISQYPPSNKPAFISALRSAFASCLCCAAPADFACSPIRWFARRQRTTWSSESRFLRPGPSIFSSTPWCWLPCALHPPTGTLEGVREPPLAPVIVAALRTGRPQHRFAFLPRVSVDLSGELEFGFGFGFEFEFEFLDLLEFEFTHFVLQLKNLFPLFPLPSLSFYDSVCATHFKLTSKGQLRL